MQVFHAGRAWAFERPAAHGQAEASAGSGDLLAPLTARVLQVMVSPGQTVQAGERLLVLEAMKMEHTLTAARDGTVAEVLAEPGAQVEAGAPLIRLEDEDA